MSKEWRAEMRAPCKECGLTAGLFEEKNGQVVVRCFWDGTYAYCQPRAERGDGVRKISRRPGVKPSQRARIFERDNSTCVICGARAGHGVILVLGHMVSVKQGLAYGLTQAELYDDENLAVMCEECNSGIGENTISVRYAVRILQIRLANKATPEEAS